MTIRLIALLLIATASFGAASAGNVRRIESRFMAPCCWHENFSVHDSPVAAQLRVEVASLTARGETEEQIVDLFVSRYGERILAEPRGRSLWILTITPIVIPLTSLSLLILQLNRWSRREPAAPIDIASLPEFDPE